MQSAMKIFLMIFVVAVISMCVEGQRAKTNRIGSGGQGNQAPYYSGRGPRNQGIQGGGTAQRGAQDGFNVNFGSGSLNNGQRNQEAQSGRQRNLNGRY